MLSTGVKNTTSVLWLKASFECIAIEVYGSFPTTDTRNRYILVTMDYIHLHTDDMAERFNATLEANIQKMVNEQQTGASTHSLVWLAYHTATHETMGICPFSFR